MKKYLAVIVLYSLFIFTLSVDSLYSLGIAPFRCLFKTIVGYPCPFCGGIRAFVSMVTLHPLEALQWNPLAACLIVIAIISLPILLLFLAVTSFWKRGKSRNENSNGAIELFGPTSAWKSFIHRAFNSSFFRKSLIVTICVLAALNWLWLIFLSPYSY